MTLSLSTLELFERLLADVTLSASAPDFEEWAVKVTLAKKDITDARAALAVEAREVEAGDH